MSNRYTLKNNVRIIEDDTGKYVLKKRNPNNIFKYLETRSFNCFPQIIDTNDEYDVYEHIEEVQMPKEQKAQDIIITISILHAKTTFFKEVPTDKYSEIYENIDKELNYLKNYYDDIMNVIEQQKYMSPSSYVLARNISLIYSCLNFCLKSLNDWYEMVKDKNKMRVCTIHNNLTLDHFIKNENPYLISWDKSIVDMPIYDLISFYKNIYLDVNFYELLKIYETRYPLMEEEKKLFLLLISIPPKLEFNNNEYKNTINVRRKIDYLYITNNLLNNYNPPKSPQHN